ncbi:MAG: hypothetical protein H0V32_06640 [Nocardioidaceae bacterium]|nr:hypothetical protein [Nocardioidaceae bacterium]
MDSTTLTRPLLRRAVACLSGTAVALTGVVALHAPAASAAVSEAPGDARIIAKMEKQRIIAKMEKQRIIAKEKQRIIA